MRLFALIGYPLTHSFSKKYFTEKFEKEGIENCRYELLELPDYRDFPKLLKANFGLAGLNVTIPHKQNIIPFLDELDAASAQRIGAVNTIKFLPDGTLKGYNTDYYGFRSSLEQWLKNLTRIPTQLKALVLGNGGAAKAVFAALADLGIEYTIVSRQPEHHSDIISYHDLTADVMARHSLIINTSPIGTYPKTEECPAIPYERLGPNHLLYDLVYNPAETLFLKKGKTQGASTHNGLPMLQLQAEKAWEIWNS
ncbi:shikimate dehydrogenase family protein [Runella slithyformis]|uniref:Shikimate dehydrogenase substrate binding domain protein n=1 Tax=Runella slithyformis (strain ATCC 29530 / DSM 19594 / LMG 11500 / NCIMB 11436 / LSU 4) TaxID=761193 RepID=A0A7U3ZJY9_RUNSL|nr:shikimate dehydrogenase [Runella slithyformis]AEI48621.1 Shikimate dehydrogenase substrate binding domain protein [Runella slithyformis DSM 19594]